MNWEKHFPLGKVGWTHWEFPPYQNIFGQKDLMIFISDLYLYSINERTQEAKVLILSLLFTIIFHFLRTLSITLILDERYIGCSIKIQNNS